MKRQGLALAALLFFVALSLQSDAIIRLAASQPKALPTPKDVLGFTPGDDRQLASWEKIVEYFKKLDAHSDRVKFEEIGKSTMGAPFVYATISAPENLSRLDEFKEIQRQLADPRTLGSPRNPALADQKARALIARGKTIVLITCGIHSTEVGSTLSSTLIAHRLADSNEPEIQEILRNTIILLVPSLNPDGVDIVKNWYDKTLGTPYEGTDPPELYHKYVGHDNNRDWYAFTQVETQLTVDKLHNAWHPQIVHDIHQMGATGARLFLPPYLPPVEPNVPKQIVEGYTELGTWVAGEMRKAGFQGITTNSTFDAWTPARAYSHYHGGVRILSETASARIASPRTVKFEDLRARGEGSDTAGSAGYDPKKESANFGPVWRGGEWKLRDITNTMTTAAFFLMQHAAQNRERWLTRFYEIGKEAVRPRRNGELDGFKIKMNESARDVLDILERSEVGFSWLREGKRVTIKATHFFSTAESTYPSPTVYVPIAQPYGGFAKAVLESRLYPDLRDSGGRPIPPYDVTAHSLPFLMDVQVNAVRAPYKPIWVPKANVTHAIGDCVLDGRKSIALYKSAVPAMDEGWTRWVLDKSVCEEFEGINDDEVRRSSFDQKHRPSWPLKDTKYKTIIIPDQSPNALLDGHRQGTMPDEYTGGLGEEGVKALREFVEAGGTLVCLNRASDFAIEQFKLPVKNVVDGLPRTDFYVPGSILRIELDTSHPIAKDMPKESIAWFENSPVFEISGAGVPPGSATAGPHAKVIARYPRDKDPLLSGWLLGADRLKGKAALVEVTMGKGRIILFGFRPQYRGQSLATYPLLFNAITQRN